MRRLLSTLIVLIILLVPVLGLSFEIEIVNNTNGRLVYQIHEVKRNFEEAEGYSIFSVATGNLKAQTQITEPQNFPTGQYIITLLLLNNGKLQVLKNHIIVDSSVVKILINGHDIVALKSV